MALVGVRPPQAQQEMVGARKGGGQTGEAIGGAIGGVLGGISGGMAGATAGGVGAVPGAIGGAIGGTGVGMGVGRSVGNFVDKPSEGTAIERRVASNAPPEMFHSERSAQLRDSLMALNNQPPEIQKQYGAPLVTAYLSSLANDHTGMALPGDQPQQPGVA